MTGHDDDLTPWLDDPVVQALRGPGTPEELGGEADYVSAFRAARTTAPTADRPRPAASGGAPARRWGDGRRGRGCTGSGRRRGGVHAEPPRPGAACGARRARARRRTGTSDDAPHGRLRPRAVPAHRPGAPGSPRFTERRHPPSSPRTSRPTPSGVQPTDPDQQPEPDPDRHPPRHPPTRRPNPPPEPDRDPDRARVVRPPLGHQPPRGAGRAGAAVRGRHRDRHHSRRRRAGRPAPATRPHVAPGRVHGQ